MADFQVQTIGKNYQKKSTYAATARVRLADLRERTGNSSLSLGTSDKIALFELPPGSLITSITMVQNSTVAVNTAFTIGDGTTADRFVASGDDFSPEGTVGDTKVKTMATAQDNFLTTGGVVYLTPGEALSNAALDLTVVAAVIEVNLATGDGLLNVPQGSTTPVSP